MNLIDLKERIALCETFSPDERSFLLDAVNATPEARSADSTLISPRNYLGRLEHLWAALSIDEGGEGLCAAPIVKGHLTVPLIAADKQRLDIIRPHARAIASTFGKPVRIVKFTKREDVEIFQP